MSKHRPRTEARRWQGPLYNTVRTPTVKTVWGTKDHIHIYIYIYVCVLFGLYFCLKHVFEYDVRIFEM